MKLLQDLFSTDYGLMSISGIFFMICMGVFFLRLFTNKIKISALQAKNDAIAASHQADDKSPVANRQSAA